MVPRRPVCPTGGNVRFLAGRVTYNVAPFKRPNHPVPPRREDTTCHPIPPPPPASLPLSPWCDTVTHAAPTPVSKPSDPPPAYVVCLPDLGLETLLPSGMRFMAGTRMHNGAQTYARSCCDSSVGAPLSRRCHFASQRGCGECGLLSGPMSLTHGRGRNFAAAGFGGPALGGGLISSPHSTAQNSIAELSPLTHSHHSQGMPALRGQSSTLTPSTSRFRDEDDRGFASHHPVHNGAD